MLLSNLQRFRISKFTLIQKQSRHVRCATQVAASEPPESAFKPASKQAAEDEGDRKAAGKDAAAGRKQERAGSVWGVFGRVSSLLSSASNGKKKVQHLACGSRQA